MSTSYLENKLDMLSVSHVLSEIETPAFIYDETVIDRLIDSTDSIKHATGCNILFSMKAFSFDGAINHMIKRLDGISVSSLFEARLARGTIGDKGTLHITTPGLREHETEEISSLCDYVSFNSLSHLKKYGRKVSPKASIGIRCNPRLSFVDDSRYDPCRRHSKLGVPLEDFSEFFFENNSFTPMVDGIHLHTNCDSSDLVQFLKTVSELEAGASSILKGIQWINLGGGYLFEEAQDLSPAVEAIDLLTTKYGLTVFLEPGASLIRSAGYLISSVVDLFSRDGKLIAILDTTVNHVPEVLEFGDELEVIGADESSESKYILAGSTCLAGDIFGNYSFSKPLEIGTKVIFKDVGAYTLAKAHTFNGINLPSVYSRNNLGEVVLEKEFTYQDYATKWRSTTSVSI